VSKYCPGHGRHWFTFYGQPGLRSPVCVRCATPNPRPLKPEEWDALLSYRELRGGVLFIKGMEGAITAEQKRRRAAQRKIRDILAEIDAQRAS
jgi:hypothetical protein